MRILIVKRDKLGDMLLTTPMLAVLRQALPGAQIEVLANTYNAWILDGNPHVNTVHCYQRVKEGGRIHWRAAMAQLRQILALRRRRYDWVIVANGDASHRAINRAAWLNGRGVVSYVDDKNASSAVTHPLPVPATGHEAQRLAGLLAPLGVSMPERLPYPRFVLPAEAADFAARWLADRGLAPQCYVTLGLGARRAKKQPSTGQIIRWTRWLHETHGLQTVFMWTPGRSDNPLYPGDDEVAQPVLEAQLPWLHPFRGALKPALGLIWHGRTSLFPDSGLMHFAAASPGGVLGFFADTLVSPPPSQWAPLGEKARWLEAGKAVSELEDDRVLRELAGLLSA